MAVSSRGAISREDRSHGMAGWSHTTQANQRPSGEGRGAATKSVPSNSGTTCPAPSTATATS